MEEIRPPFAPEGLVLSPGLRSGPLGIMESLPFWGVAKW